MSNLWRREIDATVEFLPRPPMRVEFEGYYRRFVELGPAELDAIGYNEAVPIAREPYTAYETQWARGEDLIYREEIVTAVMDEEARAAALSDEARAERDGLLRDSDWTQLADSVLDETALVLWQSYRQALRDVPQQPGFPETVEWPSRPEAE